MTEEIRKRRDANIKENCGSCIHKDVCGLKRRYEVEVGNLVYEMQTANLIQCDMKCKHHMCDHNGLTHDLEVQDNA